MATKTKGLPPVPIDEIAGRLGRQVANVTTALESRDAPLFSDWSGKLVTSWEAAAALVEDLEAERAERRSAEAAYRRYREDREAKRSGAAEEAYQKGMRTGFKQEMSDMAGGDAAFAAADVASPSTPRSRTVAREARQEALEEFDKKNPELDFNNFRKKKGI